MEFVQSWIHEKRIIKKDVGIFFTYLYEIWLSIYEERPESESNSILITEIYEQEAVVSDKKVEDNVPKKENVKKLSPADRYNDEIKSIYSLGLKKVGKSDKEEKTNLKGKQKVVVSEKASGSKNYFEKLYEPVKKEEEKKFDFKYSSFEEYKQMTTARMEGLKKAKYIFEVSGGFDPTVDEELPKFEQKTQSKKEIVEEVKQKFRTLDNQKSSGRFGREQKSKMEKEMKKKQISAEDWLKERMKQKYDLDKKKEFNLNTEFKNLYEDKFKGQSEKIACFSDCKFIADFETNVRHCCENNFFEMTEFVKKFFEMTHWMSNDFKIVYLDKSFGDGILIEVALNKCAIKMEHNGLRFTHNFSVLSKPPPTNDLSSIKNLVSTELKKQSGGTDSPRDDLQQFPRYAYQKPCNQFVDGFHRIETNGYLVFTDGISPFYASYDYPAIKFAKYFVKFTASLKKSGYHRIEVLYDSNLVASFTYNYDDIEVFQHVHRILSFLSKTRFHIVKSKRFDYNNKDFYSHCAGLEEIIIRSSCGETLTEEIYDDKFEPTVCGRVVIIDNPSELNVYSMFVMGTSNSDHLKKRANYMTKPKNVKNSLWLTFLGLVKKCSLSNLKGVPDYIGTISNLNVKRRKNRFWSNVIDIKMVNSYMVRASVPSAQDLCIKGTILYEIHGLNADRFINPPNHIGIDLGGQDIKQLNNYRYIENIRVFLSTYPMEKADLMTRREGRACDYNHNQMLTSDGDKASTYSALEKIKTKDDINNKKLIFISRNTVNDGVYTYKEISPNEKNYDYKSKFLNMNYLKNQYLGVLKGFHESSLPQVHSKLNPYEEVTKCLHRLKHIGVPLNFIHPKAQAFYDMHSDTIPSDFEEKMKTVDKWEFNEREGLFKQLTGRKNPFFERKIYEKPKRLMSMAEIREKEKADKQKEIDEMPEWKKYKLGILKGKPKKDNNPKNKPKEGK